MPDSLLVCYYQLLLLAESVYTYIHTCSVIIYALFPYSLVADKVLFNSHFHMNSFLDGIDGHLRLMPDFRPRGVADQLRPKCQVLYFPVELGSADSEPAGSTDWRTAHTGTDLDPDHKDFDVDQDSTKSDTCAKDPRPLHIVWPHRWYDQCVIIVVKNRYNIISKCTIMMNSVFD